MKRGTAARRSHHAGMTIIGFLFVAAVVVTVAMVGFRMAPAYIEYYSIQRALQKSLADLADPSNQSEARRAFDKYIVADYIDSVTARDVTLTKQGNQITASVAWTRTLHMVGNVSLFLEFEATATR